MRCYMIYIPCTVTGIHGIISRVNIAIFLYQLCLYATDCIRTIDKACAGPLSGSVHIRLKLKIELLFALSII